MTELPIPVEQRLCGLPDGLELAQCCPCPAWHECGHLPEKPKKAEDDE